MKRLPKPSVDAAEVYRKCLSALPAGAALTRLQAGTDQVLGLYQQYEQRATSSELHLFPASRWGDGAQEVVGGLSKDDLTDLYTKCMVKRDQPARTYYDRLMVQVPNGKCPFCGFGQVSTLDHFLSQSRYPSFSVLPINLVPSCTDCNKGKGSSVLDADNQIPHPYFEKPFIENGTWLYVKVKEAIPASATFFVKTPNDWPEELATRVHNYFRDLNLAARFAIEAASELISLSDYLAPLATGPQIYSYLAQIGAVERAQRRNTWKAALYEALAASAWYREGGWRRPSQAQ